MRPLTAFAATALFLAASTTLAQQAAVTGGQPTSPADPAANPYLQAAAKLDMAAERATSVLNDPARTPLTDEVRTYLARHAESLQLLRHASTLPAVQWPAIAQMDGALKDLNRFRHLANILVLQSRQDAADGKSGQAADDLLAGIALARNVGRQNLLVTRLVEVGIESLMTDRLAALLPRLSVDQTTALAKRLDALLPSTPFADTLAGELEYAKTQPIPAELLPDLKAFYSKLTAAAPGSPDDFTQAVNAAAAQFPQNPFVQTLAPSLSRARAPIAKAELKQALLRAAITYHLEGPAALEKVKDPFTQTPFTLTETPAGITFSSQTHVQGKPVQLLIPAR